MPATVASKTSVVLNDVSWDFYLRTLEEVSTGTRVTFDKGKMEIMSPVSYKHDNDKKIIARLLEIWCVDHDVRLSGCGNLTLIREDVQRGLEPDEAFYVLAQPPPPGTQELDLLIQEGPDLVLEVDITTRSIAKEPLYAEMGVQEIWFWNGQTLQVRIRNNGRFVDSPVSVLIPSFPVATLRAHLDQSNQVDQHDLIKAWRLATTR